MRQTANVRARNFGCARAFRPRGAAKAEVDSSCIAGDDGGEGGEAGDMQGAPTHAAAMDLGSDLVSPLKAALTSPSATPGGGGGSEGVQEGGAPTPNSALRV